MMRKQLDTVTHSLAWIPQSIQKPTLFDPFLPIFLQKNIILFWMITFLFCVRKVWTRLKRLKGKAVVKTQNNRIIFINCFTNSNWLECCIMMHCLRLYGQCFFGLYYTVDVARLDSCFFRPLVPYFYKRDRSPLHGITQMQLFNNFFSSS